MKIEEIKKEIKYAIDIKLDIVKVEKNPELMNYDAGYIAGLRKALEIIERS
jgi:hypothetical protein